VWLDERFESSPAALSDATTTSLPSLPKPKLAPIASCETLTDSYDVNVMAMSAESSSSVGSSLSPADSVSDDSRASPAATTDQQHRVTTTSTTTTSSRRLQLPMTLDSLSTATSSDTLVPGSPARCTDLPSATTPTQSSGLKRSLAALLLVNFRGGGDGGRKSRGGSTSPSLASHQLNALALSSATTSPKLSQSPLSALRRLASPSPCDASLPGAATTRRATSPSPLHRSPVCSPKLQRASSPISYSYSSPNIITNLTKSRAACTSISRLLVMRQLCMATHTF